MGSKVKMSELFLPRVDSSFCIVPGSNHTEIIGTVQLPDKIDMSTCV